jgi:hypothetical protein
MARVFAARSPCSTAGDGSLDLVDPCSGFLGNQSMNGHLVECTDIAMRNNSSPL